jgi:hypothetical protein
LPVEAAFFDQATGGRRTAPVNALTKKSTRNTTNKTCAIHAAFAAMPEKPNTAAMSATIKKVKAQFNMMVAPFAVTSPRCDLVMALNCLRRLTLLGLAIRVPRIDFLVGP